MYLPGFPAIASDLHTAISQVQLSLTAYLVGIAVGQLFYGPLLDRVGRKRPLYDFPKVLIQTTDKYIPDRANPLLDKMVEKVDAGGLVRDVVVLKPEHAKATRAS